MSACSRRSFLKGSLAAGAAMTGGLGMPAILGRAPPIQPGVPAILGRAPPIQPGVPAILGASAAYQPYMQLGKHWPCAQVSGAGHFPQSRGPSQPSIAKPQATPRSAHVLGMHRWTSVPAQTPLSHEMHGSHVPQSIFPPHQSSHVPQL